MSPGVHQSRPSPIGRQEHFRFLRAVGPAIGIAPHKYQRRQSRRGLLARLRALGLVNLQAYEKRLLSDPQEADRLIAAMRVTVSRFYRDPPVWDGLRTVVLPRLLAALPPGTPLAAWSAGCACGEEPHTLAMMWEDLPTAGRRLDLVATDADPRVLARARAGLYSPESLASAPPSWSARFFSPAGDAFALDHELRSRARFVQADLLADPPPTHRHLVLCRYLAATYYRGARLERALDRLLASMVPGAALVLGETESIDLDHQRDGLEPWPEAISIYRYSP